MGYSITARGGLRTFAQELKKSSKLSTFGISRENHPVTFVIGQTNGDYLSEDDIVRIKEIHRGFCLGLISGHATVSFAEGLGAQL